MSGLEHRFAVGAIARTQFVGLNPVQIGLVNVILPYHDKGENAYHKGGLGANVWTSRYDAQGINSLGASLNAAYNLHIAATTAQNLTFGLQLGFVQRQFGASNYQWGSSYDPTSNNGIGSNTSDPAFQGSSYTKLYPDIGAGILYYYNAGRDIYAPGISAYIGLVGLHLNMPNESFVSGKSSPVPILFRAHGGIELHVAKRLNASPNFLFNIQGPSTFYMAGLTFTYLLPDQDDYLRPTKLVFGSSYRNGSDLVALLGFGSKYYSLGFSYDLGIFGLSKSTGKSISAYELSLKTTFQINSKTKKSSKFHTPLM